MAQASQPLRTSAFATLADGFWSAADPHLRGATMRLHSMSVGLRGGFIGPLGVGFVRNRVTGWGFAFGHITVITLMASSSCKLGALKGDFKGKSSAAGRRGRELPVCSA